MGEFLPSPAVRKTGGDDMALQTGREAMRVGRALDELPAPHRQGRLFDCVET